MFNEVKLLDNDITNTAKQLIQIIYQIINNFQILWIFCQTNTCRGKFIN